MVSEEPHALTRQIVRAQVRLATGESLDESRTRMRPFLDQRLPPFAVPPKVELVGAALHGPRFKKVR